MSTPDPNADLVGHVLPTEMPKGVVEGTVTGSSSWSPSYVVVETALGSTVRVAAQVRRRRELA